MSALVDQVEALEWFDVEVDPADVARIAVRIVERSERCRCHFPGDVS
jgi:hypothetical protein